MAKSKKLEGYNIFHRWSAKLNLNFFGLFVGSILYLLSYTPSLMPRAWLLQAIVGGISFAIGYGIGTFLSWVFRGLFGYEFPIDAKRAAWTILPATMLVLTLVMLFLYSGWQEDIRALTGFESVARTQVILILVVSDIFAALFIGAGKLVRRFFEFLFRLLSRWIPRRVGLGLSLVIAGLVTVWIVNGFFIGGFLALADNIYSGKNASDPEGYSVPVWPEHSGSSESLIPWDTLGYQGKRFVSDTSTVEEMEEFSGEPAQIGIRIYSGVSSADNARSRAQLVVDEMRRTNALEREVLLVVTTTGSGWVEPNAIRAIEHMYNGDIATVTMQYSYLPSWISTIVDVERAQEAGYELFEAVYAEWVKLPEADRPLLIAHGLSLGSFGGQAAFASAEDMIARTDGALWLGTPNFTGTWRQITDARDEETKEIKPTYRENRTAVFAADKEDILENDTVSKRPRVLYQQHASDGVVWWNPDLLLHEPDWVREEPGKDVIDGIVWIPFVSFLQVTLDQATAGGAPDGHGHNYRTTLVYAWASVAAPAGWTNEDSDALQAKIFQVESEGGSNF